jgi:hypothetical protein
MVQRTGVSNTSASPSTPTGIWAVSASMTTSGPASLVSPRKRVPASSPTAWTVLVTATANTQPAPVQPGPAPQPGDVAHPVDVVGDQHRLRPVDGHSSCRGHQPRPLLAGEQLGKQVQGGPGLVFAVGRALHHGGIGPEGRVVDERAPVDEAEVHTELDPVPEGVQAPRGVLAVQPEVEGEVVAGAGRDDQQWNVVLGGDAGDQGLGPIPAGHP